jgi:hypothetical protein
MKTLELSGYLAGVNARKAKLAPDSAVLVVEACRNSGARRTAEKRFALRRADARAKAANVQPVHSNY